MYRDKCKLKKNDKVKVIAGKDAGKIGKVLKRHVRPSAKNRQGGIVESEAPLHWSNLMLMCNKCMAPVRVKMRVLEDGKKKRICPKCNELIDA